MDLVIAGYDGTADNVRVSAQVLCYRVDNNIGTQGQRLLQNGSSKRVVDDDFRSLLVRDLNSTCDISACQQRVRG